ncbi:peptidyl-prolyl cis-trans isomerase D [Phyllobacterium sp. YR620]|uniref:SurA N-terminal domain-containing protein n=1 Tax=Phyllobacterium sp. YR620 TaxID=1881066 RepID=UPI0008822977|nr:SurA N-terminal domain-containing protein [Phyllobacterium sp. YR620]SDP15468.1 peptidyl-prolyl cis-trans isomerase D [Phyllobacterium sp. YR620]
MLDSLRNVAQTWVVKVLMGLLVISFAGWGVSNTILGAIGGGAAIRAGHSEVSPVDYRLAYDRQLAALSQQFGQRLTREQADAIGIGHQVQGQLVAGVVLDEQARTMSLGLSRDRLAQLAAEDPAFHGPDGRFNQAQFNAVLRNAGMNPQSYLDNRAQVARRQQIVEAVADGIKAPDALLKALAMYKGESRTIDYVAMPADFIKDVADPSDDALKAYFEANKEAYGAPQYRKITYVKLEPKDIANAATVAPEEIKAEYDKNIARYTTPETRTIEQLTFANVEAAKAAHDKIAAGTSFEDVVKAEGKTMDDVRLGTFPKPALPDRSIADAIFALQPNGISDVLKGTFGPVIVRVTASTPEVIKPLSEVENDIRENLALAQAASTIGDVHDAYENARADGQSMAEAAAKENLKVVTIDAVDQAGRGMDEKQLADLPFDENQLAAVFQADVGFDNEPFNLGTNGYLWYDVTSVTPARERPLDEVKARVIANWKKTEIEKQLNAKAEEVRKRVADGTSLDVIASEFKFTKDTKRGITRESKDADLGQGGVASVFDGPEGVVGVTESATDGSKLIFKVTESIEPANVGPDAITTVEKNAIGNRLADDLLDQLVSQLQTVYPVSVNQSVIDRALAR